MDYKARAVEFIKEYGIQRINLERLYEIIKSQGYQIVPFNTYEPNESTELLLAELNLKDYSKMNRAFSFVQGTIRIVFIDDTLLDKDKLYALLHEEAHIYCGHMDCYTCSAANVEDEIEANEFVHYVLNPPVISRVCEFIKKYKIQCLVTMLVIIVMFAIPVVCKQVKSSILEASGEYSRTLEFYVTESGEKYHKKDCRIIQDKENIRKITEEEYKSGKYEPCKICDPK